MALSPPGDLFICAKDLFIAATMAGIHRTEIDLTATDARATSGGPRGLQTDYGHGALEACSFDFKAEMQKLIQNLVERFRGGDRRACAH